MRTVRARKTSYRVRRCMFYVSERSQPDMKAVVLAAGAET